jgi:PKD repeat protein
MAVAPTRLRFVVYTAALVMLAFCFPACGGRQSSLEKADALLGAATLDAVLPMPAELNPGRLLAYTLDDIVRSGSEFEAGLPSLAVSADGSALEFSSSGSGAAGMSYAIYAFSLADYDREPTLELTWATPPADFANVYIGLSNWQRNAWDWQLADPSGALVLPDLLAYIGPEPDGLLYAVVLLTNGESASLAGIQVGTNLPEDTVYIVPGATTAAPAEEVVVTVWSNGALHNFHSLEGLRVIVPQYNSYVPGSVNAGAPGGAPTTNDGIWSDVAPSALVLPTDEELAPIDLGNGEIAYDFFVKATGGNEITGATGELFNFTLAVYTDVSFRIERSDGGDLTFYHDEAGNTHYWTHDDNAGGLGITLSGNADPTAVLQADTTLGDLDLEVNFDASASSDVVPGSIVQYEFDFGDGGGFVDNGSTALASHTYTLSGKFSATVRVTDNEGAQATASVLIYAGYFDEVEDNDDLGQSQSILLPTQDLNGSIGPDSVYDGDVADWFSVTAPVGQSLVCQLALDSAGSNIQIELQNNFRGHLAWSVPDDDGGQVLTYSPTAGDFQPLRVIVRSISPDFESSEYALNVQSNPPTANLVATPPNGALPLMTTLDASGSTDVAGGSLVNFAFNVGDGLWIDNGADPTFEHTYSEQDFVRAEVRVTDNDGNIDTDFFYVAPGYVYDEVEHNDTRATGNTLTLPVVDFVGSVGPSDELAVYDGDDSDWYNFSAAVGDALQISCSFTELQLNPALELYDKNGNFLAASAKDAKNPQAITYDVLASQTPLSLIVVASSGAGDYELDIKLNPPIADLSADVTLGDPPLTVNFNASGSYDKAPGNIVKYEFDFADGAGWEDYGLTSTAMHTYNSDGTYITKLRVTDNEGLSDTASVTIRVGNPYDESEDNDDHSQANSVSFPMAGWAGSLGEDLPFYTGYDGDDADYVKFDAVAGQTLTFNLAGDSDTADIDVHLENAAGDILAESTSAEAVEMFEYTFEEDGTYYIWIELWYATTQEGYSDYVCDATLL